MKRGGQAIASEALEVLRGAAEQVLETMFFAAVSPEAPEAAGEPRVAARLSFRGEPSGTFAVSLSEAAARAIAANFVGAEKEDDLEPARVAEVVAELANMICGSVLSRLESESEFDLGPPEPVSPLEDPHAGKTLVRTLALERGVLTASIEFCAAA
jgi:CheY-specific phosphatase CheX